MNDPFPPLCATPPLQGIENSINWIWIKRSHGCCRLLSNCSFWPGIEPQTPPGTPKVCKKKVVAAARFELTTSKSKVGAAPSRPQYLMQLNCTLIIHSKISCMIVYLILNFLNFELKIAFFPIFFKLPRWKWFFSLNSIFTYHLWTPNSVESGPN